MGGIELLIIMLMADAIGRILTKYNYGKNKQKREPL